MNTSIPKNHLCNVTLLGNLVNQPEIRYQANPVVAVAELTLATNSKWFDKSSNQYKEWTYYHTVKVIGDIVERSLIHAQKGDVILIQGYLINSKKANREIIHATYAQTFEKGYTQSLNQLLCSGTIATPIKLVTTETQKIFCEISLSIEHYVYSPITQEIRHHNIIRPVQVWGKQAQYLNDNAQEDDQLIVEGRLGYVNTAKKSHLIEAQQCILHKKP